MTELDCGVTTLPETTLPETPLQRKQAAARERHSGKPRTKLGRVTDSSISRLLISLDSVARADLKEKLGPELMAAVAYDDSVLLDPATTPRQKRESADTLYKLFLNLAKAEADILARRESVIVAKTKFREAATQKIKAVADKNRTALQISRERKRMQKILDRVSKEAALLALKI